MAYMVLKRNIPQKHPVIHFNVLFSLFQMPRPLPENNTTLKRPFVIGKGENIQVGNLEVHINAAFQYPSLSDNPLVQTIYLNGWARHGTHMKFKCCLATESGFTTESGLRSLEFLEVDAVLYHEYAQWVVDMQGAEFRCSNTSNGKTVAMSTTRFDYVTFAESSCDQRHQYVMEVEHPQRLPGSLGVCLKISYGNISARKAVEWFEYQKLMNVTSVFTYHHNLDPYVMDIFKHYSDTGLLTALPIHPAVKKGIILICHFDRIDRQLAM